MSVEGYWFRCILNSKLYFFIFFFISFFFYFFLFKLSIYIGEEDRFREDSRRVEFNVCVVAIRAKLYPTWLCNEWEIFLFFNDSQN